MAPGTKIVPPQKLSISFVLSAVFLKSLILSENLETKYVFRNATSSLFLSWHMLQIRVRARNFQKDNRYSISYVNVEKLNVAFLHFDIFRKSRIFWNLVFAPILLDTTLKENLLALCIMTGKTYWMKWKKMNFRLSLI